MQANDAICLIGEPNEYEALLAVDQADLHSIRPDQTVRIKLDAFAGDVFESTIESENQISREPMRFTPPSMTVQAGGKLATRTDAAGAARPLSATYQVNVNLPEEVNGFRVGQRGWAKISADPKSLGQRVVRIITRTFRFEI